MRRPWSKRRSPVLVLVVDGVERRLLPGDKLHLTQSSDWDAGTQRGSASVTRVWTWDGEKLESRS